jgi:dihydroneopterin aldolase
MRETEITLSAMRFHTRIGVLPHEHDVGQPVEVDLTVWVAAGDRPGAIVDYRTLYGHVASAFDHGHVSFLEDAAEEVARRALATTHVARARVAVRKPHVALPGPLAYAEVVVERAHGEG